MGNTKLNTQVNLCINKIMNERIKTANANMLNSIKSDTEPLVPYRTGVLSNSATIDYSNNTLTYTAGYAGHVYTNSNAKFNTSVHPQAQAYWLRDSIAINKEKWLKDYKSDIQK